MAGIGFELRKYLSEDSFTGTVKAYGFAGLISAGPWVLSILGVMLIGLVAITQNVGGLDVRQFTTSVTWMMGASLILTGLLQLVFTRYIADRLFEHKNTIINANLFGALLLTTLVSGLFAWSVLFTLFNESFAYEFLMLANFVTLSNIWIAVIFVAGLKRFKLILLSFALGYACTVILSVFLIPYGLTGLLSGLLCGHALLLFLLLAAIIPEFPLQNGLQFDFTRRTQVFPILVVVGFFYNLGIWVDKFIFWLVPSTSEQVIGPLSSSVIYDLPIFLAYLSIIPGMAVFLLRIETDFAEAYEGFYRAVRGNASLAEIESLASAMVKAIREGFYQIVRVQGVTVLILYLLGPSILGFLGISQRYIHLFYIDLIGVAAQVLMLAILNVLFYLDKLKDACLLTLVLFTSNTLLTWASIDFGPVYYGYGFGLSMMLTTFVGIHILAQEMNDIERHTFMRDHSVSVNAEAGKG